MLHTNYRSMLSSTITSNHLLPTCSTSVQIDHYNNATKKQWQLPLDQYNKVTKKQWEPVKDTSHYDGGGYQFNNDHNSHTVEIPFISLVALLSLGFFYWISAEHDPDPFPISFAEFIHDYLIPQRVDRIIVVNNDIVKVFLKNAPTSLETPPHNAKNAPQSLETPSHNTKNAPQSLETPSHNTKNAPQSFTENTLQKLSTLLCSTVEQPNEELPLAKSEIPCPSNDDEIETSCGFRKRMYLSMMRLTNSSHLLKPSRDKVISFRIGDLTRLEGLLQVVLEPTGAKLPPVFYSNEFDWVRALRGYGPTLALTALSFITLKSRRSDNFVKAGNSGFDYASTIHHSNNSIQDRLFKFGNAAPKTTADIPRTTFADVAGLAEAKQEVWEFVEFLKEPSRFEQLGAAIPRGALLVGPPGTGKTLLARAVAGEANVPFYSMNGSDFVEMFVGVGPSRIRDLFAKARKNSPAIVFIDEIDAIGRSRASANSIGSGGSDERESTLNALLVELDGFTSKSGVVILAGTNRGDVLDPALTRPGRFDRRINLSKPSIGERKEIFNMHLTPIKLNEIHDRSEVARRLAALTPGLSGAEIRSICNEAAIIAARRHAHTVTLLDLEASVERLIGGLKHTGGVLTAKMKRQVAIHEAGHAIVGWFNEHADPILKLSIVPRASGSLGYTQMMPDEDQVLASRSAVLTKIAVLLGGRAAEHLFMDCISTGAADDLERATYLAHACVATLGFDEEIGLRSLSRDTGATAGNELRNIVDSRVQRILQEQWKVATDVLKNHSDQVYSLADLLLEKEVISFIDIKGILGPPPRELSSGVQQYVEALPTKDSSIDRNEINTDETNTDLCEAIAEQN